MPARTANSGSTPETSSTAHTLPPVAKLPSTVRSRDVQQLVGDEYAKHHDAPEHTLGNGTHKGDTHIIYLLLFVRPANVRREP